MSDELVETKRAEDMIDTLSMELASSDDFEGELEDAYYAAGVHLLAGALLRIDALANELKLEQQNHRAEIDRLTQTEFDGPR
jgi:hypothetical protein